MTKDHIVPQFYLNNFRNTNNKLNIYDKVDKKFKEKGVKTTTVIKNHNKYGKYSFENIEDYYNQNETLFANTFRDILKNPEKINNIQNKLNLSKFTIMQFIRGLKIESKINNMFTDDLLLEKMWTKKLIEDNHIEMYKYLPDFKDRMHDNKKRHNREKQLNFTENYQHIMKLRKIQLLINNSKADFITSDEPILITDIHQRLYDEGLLAQDRIIYLPLSPKIYLKWYDLYFENVNNENYFDMEYKEKGYLSNNVKIRKIKRGTVKNLNILQCHNASKEVISNDENYLKKIVSFENL